MTQFCVFPLVGLVCWRLFPRGRVRCLRVRSSRFPIRPSSVLGRRVLPRFRVVLDVVVAACFPAGHLSRRLRRFVQLHGVRLERSAW